MLALLALAMSFTVPQDVTTDDAVDVPQPEPSPLPLRSMPDLLRGMLEWRDDVDVLKNSDVEVEAVWIVDESD